VCSRGWKLDRLVLVRGWPECGCWHRNWGPGGEDEDGDGESMVFFEIIHWVRLAKAERDTRHGCMCKRTWKSTTLILFLPRSLTSSTSTSISISFTSTITMSLRCSIFRLSPLHKYHHYITLAYAYIHNVKPPKRP
jgi:hypothetical protein